MFVLQHAKVCQIYLLSIVTGKTWGQVGNEMGGNSLIFIVTLQRISKCIILNHQHPINVTHQRLNRQANKNSLYIFCVFAEMTADSAMLLNANYFNVTGYECIPCHSPIREKGHKMVYDSSFVYWDDWIHKLGGRFSSHYLSFPVTCAGSVFRVWTVLTATCDYWVLMVIFNQRIFRIARCHSICVNFQIFLFPWEIHMQILSILEVKRDYWIVQRDRKVAILFIHFTWNIKSDVNVKICIGDIWLSEDDLFLIFFMAFKMENVSLQIVNIATCTSPFCLILS